MTVTTSTLELEPPSSITTMHFLSLPLALSLQLFLLWLLGYLDPLLSSNLCIISFSSFLDAIKGYKMAISELYFQTFFALVIKLGFFVIFFYCFAGISEQLNCTEMLVLQLYGVWQRDNLGYTFVFP